MFENIYLKQMQEAVQHMRDELTHVGINELRTPEEVDAAIKGATGTTLVVVNSVCGCAAGLARPAIAMSLKNGKKPDHLYTVFAGQDKEATAQARSFFEGQPPSSPSVVLLKDGKLVHMVHRHDIEGNSVEAIVQNLTNAYDTYC